MNSYISRELAVLMYKATWEFSCYKNTLCSLKLFKAKNLSLYCHNPHHHPHETKIGIHIHIFITLKFCTTMVLMFPSEKNSAIFFKKRRRRIDPPPQESRFFINYPLFPYFIFLPSFYIAFGRVVS